MLSKLKMGLVGGMFVVSMALGGAAMADVTPIPANEVALNFSKGVIDPNEKVIIDPNVNTLLNPNMKTVIDPNFKPVVDPNVKTGLPAVQMAG